MKGGRRQNEEDVASQLVGFLQQFLEVFSEVKGKNFYLTGESVRRFYSRFANLTNTCV